MSDLDRLAARLDRVLGAVEDRVRRVEERQEFHRRHVIPDGETDPHPTANAPERREWRREE